MKGAGRRDFTLAVTVMMRYAAKQAGLFLFPLFTQLVMSGKKKKVCS